MTLREAFVLALIPVLGACSHAKPEVKAEEPAAPAPVATAAPAPAAAPAARSCTADDQCGARELCVSSRCVAITAELAECRASAHFEFDRADLLPGDLPKLQREARCLSALPAEKTLVEGNCDDRGTAQYNVALGFRRAHATAKYLADLGVPSAQLAEVSYGKELPVCSDANESCWAKNRRADVSRGAQPKRRHAERAASKDSSSPASKDAR